MAALESSWHINLCWLRSRKILNRRVIEGFFSSPLNLVWPVSLGIISLLLQGMASFYGVTKGHSSDWLSALDSRAGPASVVLLKAIPVTGYLH